MVLRRLIDALLQVREFEHVVAQPFRDRRIEFRGILLHVSDPRIEDLLDALVAALGLDAEKVKLEELLKNGDLDGWESLVEKFADARYGGGKCDAFENRETWKAAMKLMGVEEE